MFKHQGKSRTLKHNLHIAIVLSFVAGIVNATGFLAFKQLTTNVTGHFAFFINDVADFKFWRGTIYFLYIFSFLFGSIVSSSLIEKFKENRYLNVFVLPTLVESFILLSIGLSSNFFLLKHPDLLVCLLLFAMGLQNSFVTRISNAVVRTTHLTGLMTDLGIDISQLFFKKYKSKKVRLLANIKLRVYIISFFFIGGLIGGYLYSKANFKLNTLTVAAAVLLISLFYDDFRYSFIKTKRKIRQKNK